MKRGYYVNAWAQRKKECINLMMSTFFQLVIVLKKEVIKTNNVTEHEDTDKYRQLLVRTLHSCSVRFPDMAANVIPVVSFLLFSNFIIKLLLAFSILHIPKLCILLIRIYHELSVLNCLIADGVLK